MLQIFKKVSGLKKTSGFTFIEIIIVITIIGMLAAFIVGNYVTAKQRGRDSKRKADLNLIQSALEQYKADNEFYPCFSSSISECSSDSSTASTAIEGIGLISTINSANSNDLPSKYLNSIPSDPLYGNSCSSVAKGYLYWHGLGRQQYVLFANLESTTDKDATALKPAPSNGTLGACVSGTSPCAQYRITSGACSGTVYNYWITNP
jgi:type II secretion system protein G